MTKPTPLSPAAQAVLDAYESSWDGHYIDGEWMPDHGVQLAAALRAVADQVVPKRDMPVHACLASETAWSARGYVRKDLLDIAAELDGTNPSESD